MCLKPLRMTHNEKTQWMSNVHWSVKKVFPFYNTLKGFFKIIIFYLLYLLQWNYFSFGPTLCDQLMSLGEHSNFQETTNGLTFLYRVTPKWLSDCYWIHGAPAFSLIASTSPNRTWTSLCLGIVLFGRFLLRLSRIKRSKVMSMGKFGPAALNFG